MIAEKLRVLWHVLIGGWKSTPPPAAYIPFYRLHPIGLNSRWFMWGQMSNWTNLDQI